MLRIVSARKQPSKQEENGRNDKDTNKFKPDIHVLLRFSSNTETRRHRAASATLQVVYISGAHLCASVSLCLNISVNDTFIPFDKRCLTEINEKPKVLLHQPQIRQSLNGEKRVVFLDSLAFNNNTTFNENVNPKRVANLNAFVDNRDQNFFLYFKIPKFQLMNKRIPVNRFEKAGTTKRLVHGNCRVQDLLADLVLFHSSLCLCA